MPLLDGKYEIISQRLIDDTQTLFEATAPDGTAVTVVLYEFGSPELEWSFQSYRQTLRALKGQGLAAVFDLVSRPGAHYVAWHRPPGKPVAPEQHPDLLETLRALGREPREADVRLNPQGKPQIYGLAFNEQLPVSQPTQAVLEPAPVPQAPRRRLERVRLLPWLLGGLLGALGLSLFYLGFWLRADNSLLVVPPLVGQEVNAAARELHALGLAVQAEAVPSSEEAGQVLGLEPRPGTQLRRGRVVTLRYALPPGRLSDAAVPELRGRRFDFGSSGEVNGLLEESRLELGRVSRIHADIPRGTVLAQSPPAGSRLPSGGLVDVLVSDGPREALTFVPDLRGLPLEHALELARVAGLDEERIGYDFAPSARGAHGSVLEQSLPPDTPVSRDLAVLHLTVAGNPAPRLGESLLPDLWTMSRADAERALQEAGFRVGEVQVINNPSLPQGVVIQRPGAGARPGETERVDLTVNHRPVAVAAVEPTVELREPPPCEFPYRFVLERGVPEGNVIVIAQIRDGDPLPIRRLRAGGGEVIEDVWTITDPGPVTFGLTFNGYALPGQLSVRCRPAAES